MDKVLFYNNGCPIIVTEEFGHFRLILTLQTIIQGTWTIVINSLNPTQAQFTLWEKNTAD